MRNEVRSERGLWYSVVEREDFVRIEKVVG